MAFAVFISPYLPLLFMGEEWRTKRAFPYFTSHSDPKLVEQVRQGRKKEFEDFFEDSEFLDPQDETTFRNTVLNWDEQDSEVHQKHLSYYRSLIAFRKTNPGLKNIQRDEMTAKCLPDQKVLILSMRKNNSSLVVLMNFSATVQQVTLAEDLQWKMIFNTNEMDAAVLLDTYYAQTTVASLKPWSGQVYISI